MRTKSEIRAEMRARRKAVSAEARARAAKEVCTRLLARKDVSSAITAQSPIAVYLASPEELDLTEFIAEALRRQARLVAPRWNGTDYELAPLSSLDSCVPGPHGILEPPPPSLRSRPSSLIPSLWLVPGLAFARSGKRVGYGGGWYDRLLKAATPASVKLGVAYSFQLLDDLPSETHDVDADEVVVI